MVQPVSSKPTEREFRRRIEQLELALEAHHRHNFPNSDPDYFCSDCGFDGTDVPPLQAYALAIENDCDADD